MYQHMEFPVAGFQLFEKLRDFFVLRNIAHESLCARKRENQVFRLHLHALVLISDGEVRPCRVQSLGNCPGDRALVGHSEDDRCTTLQVLKHSWNLRGKRKNTSILNLCAADTLVHMVGYSYLRPLLTCGIFAK